MKTIEIYQKYILMPQLIKHQLRVAGVAKLITDTWDDRKAADLSVRACLLHDMGNMAKFSALSDKYWIEEQKKFWEKYGHEAHEATYKIIEDAGLGAYNLILQEEGECYNNPATPIFALMTKPAIMVLYCDLRVAITGVVPMYTRIKDLITRYPQSSRPETTWGAELERYVQVLTSIKLEEITEDKVKLLFDDLLALEW